MGTAVQRAGRDSPVDLRYDDRSARSHLTDIHEEDAEDAIGNDANREGSGEEGDIKRLFIPFRETHEKWMREDLEYRRLRELHRLPEDMSLAFIGGRLNSDLTQQQVAERMGTTQSVVARMENGRHLPSLRSIERYAKALGLKLEIKLVLAD